MTAARHLAHAGFRVDQQRFRRLETSAVRQQPAEVLRMDSGVDPQLSELVDLQFAEVAAAVDRDAGERLPGGFGRTGFTTAKAGLCWWLLDVRLLPIDGCPGSALPGRDGRSRAQLPARCSTSYFREGKSSVSDMIRSMSTEAPERFTTRTERVIASRFSKTL